MWHLSLRLQDAIPPSFCGGTRHGDVNGLCFVALSPNPQRCARSFPFVDAIMTQLRQEGWIHHLARHMVACFLTRGDLFQSWTAGAKVFDRLLLDADWSINNFNWMWLSCSGFFYQV